MTRSKNKRKLHSHASAANAPAQSSSTDRSSSWSLPLELSLQILALLPHRDIRSFSLCCRSIYTICRSHHLYSAIRIGGSYEEAFLYPEPDLLSLSTKPDRFTNVYSRSTNVIIYDVEQIEQFNIGPLIREAFVGIGRCKQDDEALRRFLRLCPNLKSLHIIGHTPPEQPLAPSTAMMDIRNISSSISLEQLEFSWIWQGKYSTILDASSDGPKGLKKLKMTLKCDAYSKLPIPRNMLPRMVKRAAANSIDTITELDLSCWHGQIRGPRGSEVDLACFKGMPLKILRFKTSPENIDGGNIPIICDLFPKLEELFLDEEKPRVFWRNETKKANLANLAKLKECRKLTLSYHFAAVDWFDFTTWTEYDDFLSTLPTQWTFEYFGRELLNRVEATQKIVERLDKLERIAWLDHRELPRVKDRNTGGILIDNEDEGRYIADVIRGLPTEDGTGVRINWEFRLWWDYVVSGKFGPDSKGRDLEGWWSTIYKETRKRAVENGEVGAL